MISEFDPTIVFGGLLIASLVGFLTGIFGIGGGFLATPALIIFLGIPAPIAIGTDLTMILVNSSFGIFKRRGSGTVDTKLAMMLGLSSIAGVLLGVKIIEILKGMDPLIIGGEEQPAVQYIVLWVFLVLMVGICAFMLFDYRYSGGKSPDKRIGLLSRIKLPPYIEFPLLEHPRFPFIVLLLLASFIGTVQGFLGIGGGILWLPALVYLIGHRTINAAGTSLMVVWISALFASGAHITQGNINVQLLAAMLGGGLVGVHYGTKLGLKLAGPKLRLYFIHVLMVAVAIIAYKLFSMIF